MSVNSLILNSHKDWCNIRVNDLTVDGHFNHTNPSGNLTVDGNLIVNGTTTLNGNVTIDAAATTTIDGPLNLNGNVTIDAAAHTTVSGSIDLDGVVALNNNLTSDATSLITFNGDLGIDGTISSAKGSVTQLTSINTGVTINNSIGTILSVANPGILSGANNQFTVTNDKVLGASDMVLLTTGFSSAHTNDSAPAVSVIDITLGSFKVFIHNAGPATIQDELRFDFMVINA